MRRVWIGTGVAAIATLTVPALVLSTSPAVSAQQAPATVVRTAQVAQTIESPLPATDRRVAAARPATAIKVKAKPKPRKAAHQAGRKNAVHPRARHAAHSRT